ncbi:MAG: SMC-Scp complex subunit ScpB [Nitrospinae bacterium]|nr:SMC-Scp complex subunit ScpB [Nitrospinota bacterium]
MDREQLKAILENLLFIADAPVTVDRLAGLFEKEATREEIQGAMEELISDYEGRNLMLTAVGEGYRIQTRPENAPWITAFFKMEKGQRLGRASLEALAIIAYRQPITRAEVDEIRGVDSGAALRGLVEKNLVKAMGRRKAPGKPMMYGTTKRFLEYFGLARLADLPTMEEFQREMDETLGAQGSFEFAEDDAEGEISEHLPEAGVMEDDVSEGGVKEDGLAVIQEGFDPEEGEDDDEGFVQNDEEAGEAGEAEDAEDKQPGE